MLSVSSESEFEVYYLGMVQNVNLGMHLSQKSDVLLIDKIEEVQVDIFNICPIAIFIISRLSRVLFAFFHRVPVYISRLFADKLLHVMFLLQKLEML